MRRLTTAALKVLVFETVLAAALFGSAGRIDLPWFWALIAVHGTIIFAGSAALDPELNRERLRPAAGPAGKEYAFRIAGTVLILAHLVVAGLDAGRFHWSVPPPALVRGTALALYAGALAFSMWAMAANRFFSSVVRIQEERGHRVIDTGPYRYVRHPGYAGLIVTALLGGVVFGSWRSVVPMMVLALGVVRRLRMEDAFLQGHLDGYADYAGRVRSKLLPGVW
jgi:protein-S-isoprenylcysteine O-methyltransferase Ste14